MHVLEPRVAVYFSSASRWLRARTQALLQQLRAEYMAEYEAAAALCRKLGLRSCKELREAKHVHWSENKLSAAELATLGTLGSVLPAFETLSSSKAQAQLAPTACSGWLRGWARTRCYR